MGGSDKLAKDWRSVALSLPWRVTLAPLFANTRAIPRPIPRLEPVIRQILSANIPADISQNILLYPRPVIVKMGKYLASSYFQVIRPERK
jgi:hypothetical protein